MRVIKAQKIPKKQNDPEETLALFCFYFPAYAYHEARQLPYKRIVKMLKVVRKEQARQKIDLLNIVTAPHSKKGQAVKKLMSYYQQQMEI